MAYGSGALHRLPLHLPLHASYSSFSRVSCFTRHLPQVLGLVDQTSDARLGKSCDGTTIVSAPRFQVRGASSDPKLKDISQATKPQQSQTWKIKMLYDGECPLCMREVNMLRERNQAYGTIKFVDISSDSYSPDENQGLDYKTVMGRIHAIQSDGIIYTDVEAFRRLYEEVGLGWVYYITKYEPISTVANAVYRIWAKYRLKITGRPSLEQILESKKNMKALINGIANNVNFNGLFINYLEHAFTDKANTKPLQLAWSCSMESTSIIDAPFKKEFRLKMNYAKKIRFARFEILSCLGTKRQYIQTNLV